MKIKDMIRIENGSRAKIQRTIGQFITVIGWVLVLWALAYLIRATQLDNEIVPELGLGIDATMTGAFWCGLGLWVGLMIGVPLWVQADNFLRDEAKRRAAAPPAIAHLPVRHEAAPPVVTTSSMEAAS